MLLRLLEGEEGTVKKEDQQPTNDGDQQQTDGQTNADAEVKNDNPVAGETTDDNTNSQEASSVDNKDETTNLQDGQQNSENAPKDNVESKDG